MRTVRLGLIGSGGIAQAHCRAISEVEGIEIVAVADIVREKAEHTAAQFKIATAYADYRQMLKLEDIEGVIVCTPTAMHVAPTVDALKAGKHVLCEKPMEATLDAAAEMVRTAHTVGKIMMVALKLRFSPQVITARRIVEEGTLGDIYYAECVADRRRGNPGGSFVRKDTAGFGAAADIGVYALDTALYIMGHPMPVSVAAITSNYLSKHNPAVLGAWNPDVTNTEVEDFGVAWVRFENGIRMVFKTSWCMHLDSLGGTFFLGTRAGLRIGVSEVKGPEEGVWVYRDEFGTLTNTTAQFMRPLTGLELFKREDAAFADAIREGKPSPIDPDGVLLTNVIIQGVIDSAAAGGREIEVTVPKVS